MGSARILVFASRPQLFEFAAHVATAHGTLPNTSEIGTASFNICFAISRFDGPRSAARKNLNSAAWAFAAG